MKFLTAYQLLKSTGMYEITPPAQTSEEKPIDRSSERGTEAESSNSSQEN